MNLSLKNRYKQNLNFRWLKKSHKFIEEDFIMVLFLNCVLR